MPSDMTQPRNTEGKVLRLTGCDSACVCAQIVFVHLPFTSFLIYPKVNHVNNIPSFLVHCSLV